MLLKANYISAMIEEFKGTSLIDFIDRFPNE
ncbi:MAG: hypothetical protein ACJA2S_002087, partial [Cyclobacteriaceae bacterium]